MKHFKVDRRQVLVSAATVVPLSTYSSVAHSEPLTIATILSFIVKSVVVGAAVAITLDSWASQARFQKRSVGAGPFPESFPSEVEVKPEFRSERKELNDGTVTVCHDGQVKRIPKGALKPDQRYNLSPGEILLCSEQIRPETSRAAPDPDTKDQILRFAERQAKRALRALRYEREMSDKNGGRYVLISAIPEDKATELLMLWKVTGRSATLVRSGESPKWSIEGASWLKS